MRDETELLVDWSHWADESTHRAGQRYAAYLVGRDLLEDGADAVKVPAMLRRGETRHAWHGLAPRERPRGGIWGDGSLLTSAESSRKTSDAS